MLLDRIEASYSQRENNTQLLGYDERQRQHSGQHKLYRQWPEGTKVILRTPIVNERPDDQDDIIHVIVF